MAKEPMVLLELRKIDKSFPGVRSLNGVDFSVRAGEVHALVGENGAGKSTLMKVLSGGYIPDGGEICVEGKPRRWRTPADAIEAGIHVIHQELMLFPERTVAENIYLTKPPRTFTGLLDRGAMNERAAKILNRLGHDIDPLRKVGTLTIADQQMVEIAKALSADVRLLVLDEPTAVLSRREAELLFERVMRLREQGVGIVYISHRLDEIFRLADRITVLKDGTLVATQPAAQLDRARLVSMMIGREVDDIYPAPRVFAPSGDAVLKVTDLAALPRVKSASLQVFPGEIVGIGGLVGAGRSEVAHAIFGSGASATGRVELDGRSYNRRSPARSIEAGIGFLTEDRKAEGVLMLMDCARNIAAPVLASFTRRGMLDPRREDVAASEDIRRFRIAIPGPRSLVRNLSGGNQQKVLLARWARACRRVLILDEPTRGVDVGAKVEIYRFIRELADSGVAILMISSELNELVGMSDRIVVMREGVTVGTLTKDEISEESVMKLAMADIADEGSAA